MAEYFYNYSFHFERILVFIWFVEKMLFVNKPKQKQYVWIQMN